MSNISDDELKERIFSLLLTKEYEDKATPQKKAKSKTSKPNENVTDSMNDVKDSYLIQYLIDQGLGIHEKDLNKILLQTIKEEALSSGVSQTNKINVNREIEQNKKSPLSPFGNR